MIRAIETKFARSFEAGTELPAEAAAEPSKEAAQRSHRLLKLQQSLSREAAARPLNVLRSSFGMLRIIIETEFWELVSSFEAGAELWEPAFQGKLPRGL